MACAAGPGSARPGSLGAVERWAYQLQGYGPVGLAELARADFDLAVVDAYGDSGKPWTGGEVAALKRNKIALAYLSIGEAEDYRPYWREGWRPGTPSWLLEENPDWPGNFAVRYWDAGWRQIVLEALGTLVDAGFDGVYLDKVDSFETFDTPEAKAAMVDLVLELGRAARARRPGFLVLTQNAAELLGEPRLAAALDGTGQEELWYAATDRPVPEAERAARLAHLDAFRARGGAVLTVDYASRPEHVRETYAHSRARGFAPYVADVALDRLRPEGR